MGHNFRRGRCRSRSPSSGTSGHLLPGGEGEEIRPRAGWLFHGHAASKASITRPEPRANHPPGWMWRPRGLERRGSLVMRWSAVVLSAALVVPASASADDKVLDWVRVTEEAGWQARDSSGELVYKDRLWILGGWFQ